MSLVVADTAPLRYLVEIQHEFLLCQLFTTVWIPGAVLGELQMRRTPAAVREWTDHLPS